MKKTISLMLVIVFMCTLVACKDEKDTSSNTSENTSITQSNNTNSTDNQTRENNNSNASDTTSTETTSSTKSNPTISTSKTTTSSKPSSSSTPSTSKPTETNKQPTSTHTHFYSKRVMAATCIEKGYTTYTCSCGDVYKDNFVEPAHNFKKNVCTVCGAKHDNYNLYQTEYNQLTADYNAKVSEFETKIAKSNKNIEACQKAINNATSALYSLSPTCPQWYIQEYVNNWQAFGSTSAATQAARNAWSQEYNSQRAQLNNTISMNTSKMQAEQQNIMLYNSAISTLTTQYNNDVSALKIKYGMN